MDKVKCPACGVEFEYDPQNPYCPNCGAVVSPPSQQSKQQQTPQRYVIYAVRQDGSRERVAEVVEGGPEVVLGRYELYSYALRDPDTISRVHVRFVVKGGKLYVRDDGSINGTYVDGQDIRGKGEVELPPGKEALLVNPKVPVVRLVAESA
jgi:pSer/pThr/pTyr-binding forkhead associated (FHA) protein